MSMPVGFERCLTFINCQAQTVGKAAAKAECKHAVTISRQCGCSAHTVAEKAAAWLQEHSPKDAPPWTIFDRNLMERVLTDHQLPERLARFTPEDRVLEIEDILNELFSLRPASWTMVEKTAETILHLAGLGNVILLGRGANIVTAKLPGVVHVRLVGSLENRAASVQQGEGLDRKAALEFIRQHDLGRKRYVKKYFRQDIDDPLLYSLVINTDHVSPAAAAQVIGELVLAEKPG